MTHIEKILMVANISKRSTTELIFFLKDIRASKAVRHQKQQKMAQSRKIRRF